MVPSSLRFYLRLQRIRLGIFRFGRWWFTYGLETLLLFSRLLWSLPLTVAYLQHSVRLAWMTDVCIVLYWILYKKVIFPRMAGWFIGRYIICEDILTKMLIGVIAHCLQKEPSTKVFPLLESRNLNLKPGEIRMMKSRLKSYDFSKEVAFV